MARIKGYTGIHSSPPSARVWVLEVGFDMMANVQDTKDDVYHARSNRAGSDDRGLHA